MVESSKQVRVDNWGIFFLQRLQMFFSKTDYCDLTLQFEGNVQLKVHRLVMNACTEYFTFLEQTCPALEESTIMMPADLQADVIVPIVNFMYTGMLEFHMTIFEKLYKAAELMNITVLTKLLDAQKSPLQTFKPQKKKTESPQPWNSQSKKNSTKAPSAPELPATLPGRKLPVWKRKNIPAVPMQHPTSQLHFSEQKWSQDPLSLSDNTPKPTRFEWPDDDLPPINLMDTSFEEISYTSKPLLTQEEENRASTSFDEVRNNANSQSKKSTGKSSSGSINMKEVEDYVKEQKIRIDMEEDEYNEFGQKRKLDQNSTKSSPKRMKINDKENKETTISVKSSNGTELDHTKIVSEILKKYPHLVKKNKNIRLKIMASGNKNVPEQKAIHTPIKTPKMKVQVEAANKSKLVQPPPKSKPEKQKFNAEGPWTCDKCVEAGEVPPEFVLYYLYRKHMTDVHCEVFDLRLCKYCGRRCGKHNLMMYHLYTKHGLKPPTSYNFPKCDQCPYIALSAAKLTQHKLQHGPNEMQCLDCKLAFASQQSLAAHVQITGHFNKAGKSSYDCQYCAKKLQSAINLFSHIKNSHLKEAKRDGIVSLDELDDVEEADEDEDEDQESEEEYIVPEMMPDTALQKDKVKIISNVKVPIRADQQTNDSEQSVTLEPSSEAEALTNVASGIATSLGLVDIVVLDENQQYILQQQESQEGQPEYILPELTTGGNPFSGQVITTQHSTVLPQGMLQSSGSDIGSTDELVMVLTDHDYQDEQEGVTADNSNIVVLYSHPVDGQQGQFITSQGNLLVNSQTGMLEIRNGTTIATTTASQMVVSNTVDTPTESIEMIQKEIESHTELKQEPYYEEDRKPNITHIQPEKVVENLNEQPEEQVVQNEEITEHVESEQENQNESLEDTRTNTEENEEIVQEVSAENEEVQSLERESEDKNENQDNVDGRTNVLEEPMEIDETEQTIREEVATNDQSESVTKPVEETPPTEKVPEQSQEATEKTAESDVEEKGEDVPPDVVNVSESSVPVYEQSETLIINDPALLYEHEDDESTDKASKDVSDIDKNPPEPMEVDGKTEEQPQEEKDVETKDEDKVVEEQSEDCADNQKDKEDENKEESASEFQHHSEISNSQSSDEDENSQSSQENAQNNRNSSINQTILDDWDDTDSQQSEKQRTAMKEAAENVNKLMDDWEEEEEEDKREAN
ncbi:hypothetical protein NQ314_005854 [Rhamnusium bicolor]|uniref:Centrosome-associated zinc finger protein CP190 n=1 Tax=Rhamnusium bicolor TaxID=1586634 RepID=A0AAV8ZDE0_9CUCU|nr:hypothetical protein NQ314_005854 [Rhamnusium bicolor]